MDPKSLQYTETHQWCLVEGSVVTVGLTDVMARKIGPIVFVELPDAGDDVLSDEPFGEVESFKRAHELYSPADGVIQEVNTRLCDDPAPITDDPYGAGWLVKVRVDLPDQLENLLTYEEYRRAVRGRR